MNKQRKIYLNKWYWFESIICSVNSSIAIIISVFLIILIAILFLIFISRILVIVFRINFGIVFIFVLIFVLIVWILIIRILACWCLVIIWSPFIIILVIQLITVFSFKPLEESIQNALLRIRRGDITIFIAKRCSY